MTRLILTGAGASFGSKQVTPRIPPLGKDLFSELRSMAPDLWGALPEDVQTAFEPNFELGMARIWNDGQVDVGPFLRIIGLYFSQFRPGKSNTYRSLLTELSSIGVLNEVVFSSLNYECLLEYVARDYGIQTISYQDVGPCTSEQISVLKIHGSCNFMPHTIAASPGMLFGTGVTWEGVVRIVDCSEVGPYLSNSALHPAMAVFMEGKPVQSCPGIIRDLQTRWAELVSEVEVVGLIGVRPNPDDAHIWEPLASTNARLVVVGNTSEYEAWQHSQRPTLPTEVVGSYFSDSLLDFVARFAA